MTDTTTAVTFADAGLFEPIRIIVERQIDRFAASLFLDFHRIDALGNQ